MWPALSTHTRQRFSPYRCIHNPPPDGHGADRMQQAQEFVGFGATVRPGLCNENGRFVP